MVLVEAKSLSPRHGESDTDPIQTARTMMSEDGAYQALAARVEQLTHQLGVMEDVHAVRCLHFIYGYYIDMCLYDEACALFADDGAVRFLNGLYKGRAGVRRLYCDWFRKTFTKGHNGPVYGFLLDHLQMQDIVTVAPDRRSARARFRALNMIGYHDKKPDPLEHMPQQFWGGGIYENVYVKDAREVEDQAARLCRPLAGALRTGLGAQQRASATV